MRVLFAAALIQLWLAMVVLLADILMSTLMAAALLCAIAGDYVHMCKHCNVCIVST